MELNDQGSISEGQEDQDSLFIEELLKIRDLYEADFEAISGDIEERAKRKSNLQLLVDYPLDEQSKNNTQIEISYLDEEIALLKLKELINRFYEGYVDADDSELLNEIKKEFDWALIGLRKAQFLRLELYAEKIESMLDLAEKNDSVKDQFQNLIDDLANLENFKKLASSDRIDEIVKNNSDLNSQFQLLINVLVNNQEILKEPELMTDILKLFAEFLEITQNLVREPRAEINSRVQSGQNLDDFQQQELKVDNATEILPQKELLRLGQLESEELDIAITEDDQKKTADLIIEENFQSVEKLEKDAQIFFRDVQSRRDLLQEKLKLSEESRQEIEAKFLQQQNLQQELQKQLESKPKGGSKVLQKQIQDCNSKLLDSQTELEKINQEVELYNSNLRELDEIIAKVQAIQQQNKLILERNKAQLQALKKEQAANLATSQQELLTVAEESGKDSGLEIDSNQPVTQDSSWPQQVPNYDVPTNQELVNQVLANQDPEELNEKEISAQVANPSDRGFWKKLTFFIKGKIKNLNSSQSETGDHGIISVDQVANNKDADRWSSKANSISVGTKVVNEEKPLPIPISRDKEPDNASENFSVGADGQLSKSLSLAERLNSRSSLSQVLKKNEGN